MKHVVERCTVLESFLREVSITVKKRLTDDAFSSSRNTAVYNYSNLKYEVSRLITCTYTAKNSRYI